MYVVVNQTESSDCVNMLSFSPPCSIVDMESQHTAPAVQTTLKTCPLTFTWSDGRWKLVVSNGVSPPDGLYRDKENQIE